MTKRKELARLRQYVSDVAAERDAWQAKCDRANRAADDLQAMLDHARRQRDEVKDRAALIAGQLQDANDRLDSSSRNVFDLFDKLSMQAADLECARVDLKRVIEVGNRLAANDHRSTRAHRDWKRVTGPIVADPAAFPSEATQ